MRVSLASPSHCRKPLPKRDRHHPARPINPHKRQERHHVSPTNPLLPEAVFAGGTSRFPGAGSVAGEAGDARPGNRGACGTPGAAPRS